MKIINRFLPFLVATRMVLAVPVTQLPADLDYSAHDLVAYGSDQVELRSRNIANPLEARIDCQRIGNTILRIGTSAAVVAFVHLGTDYAAYVCEQEAAERCVRYVGYVQHALDAIFLVMGYMHGSVGTSTTNQQQSFESGSVRRDLPSNTMWDALGPALQSDGWKFDTMEQIDVSNVSLTKRDSDPSLVHRSIARNVAVDDQGNTSDIAFNFFDNGDLNLHFAGDFGHLPSGIDQSATMHRRFDGAGFKIAATTRVQSKLTRDHERSMAYYIAQDWANDAYRMSMSDYIGLVKTDHTANFYFRIIPEIKGFGLNYESVNICGQLAPFL
ncbi:uncharacterized protein N7496_005802 [Penicillium cataractarum]|uniref:Uncharacterized protein n=1 Tax=Penicillium cataractarum TaxID=2100454 RepID=A0A9W9S0K9_9EURO|nr:uncharacterized protein N7496_005802 [Penicillium cataractarum]KAJ5369710.1 hypothetical protein N7496_005802 [Penicillium cataractarum]